MAYPTIQSQNPTCWFLGASWSSGDQFERFIADSIWQNGYADRYIEQVNSIKPNDRVAIKSAYTRKSGVPFETNGNTVSVIAIKAIGIVTENLKDGKTIRVSWTRFEKPREWYFFTFRGTIWKVLPDEPMKEALIGFAFEGMDQDYDQFINHPFWKDRFGIINEIDRRFKWTKFYESLANGLVKYKTNRAALITQIYSIYQNTLQMEGPVDQYADGTTGPWRDIDPFTTFGLFNKGIKNDRRIAVAEALAKFLGINVPIPKTFEAIPILINLKAWYFRYEKDRAPHDIDLLWDFFEVAIQYADQQDADQQVEVDSEQIQERFSHLFDRVMELPGVGWTLTCALFWIRPWTYPTLDSSSRVYITKKLKLAIDKGGSKNRVSASEYLVLMDNLQTLFKGDQYSVHSYPDLSLAAFQYSKDDMPGEDGKTGESEKENEIDNGDKTIIDQGASVSDEVTSYTLDDIIKNGCFYSRDELDTMYFRLRDKKNLILQGPPGTGKTWLAKRLAFAFIGQKDEHKVRSVQFHPNLSYEDFVRGWRPSGEGKLSLTDGPFMEMIQCANDDPQTKYVIVIEEINRGNPAQIFGEMLTLIEADKRTPNEAMELSYRRFPDERIFVPPNLHIIGTMNIADRSLALVDYALRRRFAFIDLEPRINSTWKSWLNVRFNIDMDILNVIAERIDKLNSQIASDPQLGSQFCIGHSYVTPAEGNPIKDAGTWFKQIVRTEIIPLLREYWYDTVSGKIKDIEIMLTEGL